MLLSGSQIMVGCDCLIQSQLRTNMSLQEASATTLISDRAKGKRRASTQLQQEGVWSSLGQLWYFPLHNTDIKLLGLAFKTSYRPSGIQYMSALHIAPTPASGSLACC
jgi:hypothetical protein